MTAECDLKRADWRFVLPSPTAEAFRHLVLLGGPPTLSDRVLQLGLARRVSREIPSSRCADALVVLDDAGVDLSKASGCVSVGGAVYWEVPRRWKTFFRTTPRAIRRKLLESGLSPLALYWPRPDYRRVAMYLPIGPRGVFSWYAEVALEPRTLSRRIGRVALKFLTREGAGWPFTLIPRFAATAVAGGDGSSSSLPWSATRSGAAAGPDQSPVVFCGGDSSRRVVIFPFSSRSRSPECAIKLWRLPHRNANSEAEQAVLRRIRSALDSSMRRTVPEPLGTIRWNDSVAAIESYAPGPPLSHRLDAWGRRPRRKMADVELVFDWIGKFHRQARHAVQPWDRSAIEHWVEGPIARYRSAFGATPDEERLFHDLRRLAKELSGTFLPILWAHPDLTAANVHVEGRRITVIDWSGATARLPLFDLLYFSVLVTSRIRRLRGAQGRLRCFRDLFVEAPQNDPIISSVREAMHRYVESIGVDFRFFPLLVALNWIFRSLECSERAEAVARGVPGANPHPDESYVEYVRMLGANVERLFVSTRG